MSQTRSDQLRLAGTADNSELTKPTDTRVISGVRISHDTATAGDIQSAYHADMRRTLARLVGREEVAEAFFLQTCHRVEAYVVTDAASVGQRVLSDYTPIVDSQTAVKMSHEESLRHLLRVAAGLESLVLGEDQILGQIRDAYVDAREANAIDSILEPAVLKAIHVGERARTETAINDGVCSIGSATVKLADDRRDLDGTTALVIGAGDTSGRIANAFADSGIGTLYIANRSVPHARRLADDVDLADARAIGLAALRSAIAEADVIASATASDEYILEEDCLDDCGKTLVIDAARPRDVSPAVNGMKGVSVCDLDTLESVIDESKQYRQIAAESVEAIVECEFERLRKQYKRQHANEVIATMYKRAEKIKSQEVSKAISRSKAQDDNHDAQGEIFSALADALINHLLADPTMRLRDAADKGDWSTIEAMHRLFGPEFDDEAGSACIPDD